MTFLQLSEIGKKATLAFIIISCLSLSVFAQKTGTQDQGKRYGQPGFVGEAINLNVVNADIRDILNYITEQYGVNFVIDKSVSKVSVTVNISDVPWNIALDSILRSQELGIQVSGPILRVADAKTLATEADTQNKIKDNQLDSSPLYTEFIRLNYSKAMGGASGPAFSAGTAAGSSTSSDSGDGILPIIKRRLSRRGAIETDSRTNSLIITDVRENIDAIRQLVAILDQPELQVEVEARVVVVSRDFSRDIGFQLSGLTLGNGVGNGAGIQGNTGAPIGSGTNTGVLGNQANSSLGSQIANSVIGLTTGVFGTARINAVLTAGEKKGQAKTIATPRVTTLNNQQATIESGQQIPVVTSQTGANGGGVVFTTTYVAVPLKLDVTPQINDKGSVILDVVVENSSISSTVAAGGTPAINVQRTKTKVEVPDGGTTVVGGALIDSEGENKFTVPGLSKIPVVGNLFKRKAVARSTSEVMFFITPRIYRPDTEISPTAEKPVQNNRSTTILQPVPLGNPPSNSLPSEQQQQPATMQPVPTATQPATTATPGNGTIKP